MKNPMLKDYVGGEDRVYRGGSRSSYPFNVRALWRDHDSPTSFYYYGYGFRLFRSQHKN